MSEEKSFYMRKDENIVKKILFFESKDGGIGIVFDDDKENKVEGSKLVGEVVYTLKNPDWRLKNHIRSGASISNMIGGSSTDPYIFNNLIVEYLLKDWSLDHKFELEKNINGFEVIKDVNDLIGSDIEDFIFDAVVLIYNRFIA